MLSTRSAAVVRATLPAVREHGTAISAAFYESMFAAHPGLLNLFNRGNQANGEQRRALAGSVVAYAEHLLGEGKPGIDAVVGRIAHKHASLGIRPEQYTVVGKHLIGAVGEVLGDAVTPAVAAAWEEVYWLFAVRLIAAETRLYQQHGVDPADELPRWRVTGRRQEAEDVVSLRLSPLEGPVPQHLPGQYVTVAVDLPDGGRQARQYTISHAAGNSTLRITVRKVRGTPDGVVSGILTSQVRAGDELRVSRPFGDAVLDEGTEPLLLASAGIGITRTAALLEHVARHQPGREVLVVHAEREPGRYALADHIEHYGAQLASFRHLVFFDEDAPSADQRGPVRPDEIELPPGVTAHLCGPIGFMRDLRTSLRIRGVPAERIHYEVFGPDLWATDAADLPAPAAR
ncbi:nitric oxide dioxygenase [Amycolatopsis bartoniae]|uniref:nitric oxide dioxygenase n=1 Tax=Amycolatopsis bartoniae TaxID=941986 RepID=A0A8H9IUB7_9PSEU|nr:globin domain-containing protein [Amycolatopsis bartoniae]MBB2940087.1 nitric oxide dioxygenase [Amycolatopsis bartoniae]TVS98894.1 hemin transporter [Amycolatopsis bartoniae]GHF53845.1 hemin transporter [Amycolatopsis bartoniae]